MRGCFLQVAFLEVTRITHCQGPAPDIGGSGNPQGDTWTTANGTASIEYHYDSSGNFIGTEYKEVDESGNSIDQSSWDSNVDLVSGDGGSRPKLRQQEAVLEVEDQARLAAPMSGRKKIDLSRESEISFGIGAKSECNRSG